MWVLATGHSLGPEPVQLGGVLSSRPALLTLPHS